MTNLSIGKIRGIQEIADADGLISILAIDHRGDALKLPDNGHTIYEDMRDFKLSVMKHLAKHASAVLVDPVYSGPDAIARGVLPGDKGFLVAVEAAGYESEPQTLRSRFLSNWSMEKVKRMGASVAKLYFFYNPYAGEDAEHQERFIARLVDEARTADLPLLVEPICYPLDPTTPKSSAQFAAQRPELVIESARRIGALGVDLLKLEFPHDANFHNDEEAWADACAALDEASPVPWVLLSAGVDFETFKWQVKVACRAGASGHATGRAAWKEAVDLTGAAREEFLHTVGAARMAELADITRAYGRPWTARYPDLASAAGEGWLARYTAT